MSLFPQDPNFRGRRVVTFDNQRDFMFFRHHRYIFETKETKQSDTKGTAKKAKDAKGENITDQRTIARLQARPYYKRVFSLVAPFDRSNSSKHQDTLIPIQSLPNVPVRWRSKKFRQQDEQFNSYQECSATCDNGAAQKSCEAYKDYSPVSVCESKLTLSPRDNHEDCDSQRSSNDSDVLEELSEQQSPQKSLPNLTDDSAFISQDLYEFLKSSLPNIVMGRQWVLLYRAVRRNMVYHFAHLSAKVLTFLVLVC